MTSVPTSCARTYPIRNQNDVRTRRSNIPLTEFSGFKDDSFYGTIEIFDDSAFTERLT